MYTCLLYTSPGFESQSVHFSLFSRISWRFMSAGSFLCNMTSIRLNAEGMRSQRCVSRADLASNRTLLGSSPRASTSLLFLRPVGFLAGWFFTTTLFCSLYFFNFRFSPLLFLCILYYNTSDFLIFVPCIYLLC